MSVLSSESCGFVVSHSKLVTHFLNGVVKDGQKATFYPNQHYFSINKPYKCLNRKQIHSKREEDTDFVSKSYESMLDTIYKCLRISIVTPNIDTRALADSFYVDSATRVLKNVVGGNNSEEGIFVDIENECYFVPANSRFYCCDVSEMSSRLHSTYDVIVLDPPWWNKYIRRKRAYSKIEAYHMMRNEDLAVIPIDSLLREDGLIAVWCTNSNSHLNTLLEVIFPQWNVQYIATWFWLKVTVKGEPVTPFSSPNGKQPYERIVFATRNRSRTLPLPEDKKLVVSVPNAIHSYKPPLSELLKPYLGTNPQCLEVFARSLIPNWTSYGNEVLKLQHISLFTEVT